MQTPSVIFTETNTVIPDLIWISHNCLAQGLDDGGHLTVSPELVIEIVSPGKNSGDRDRHLKRKLYSIHGVQEYWIVDWQCKNLEVYRREVAQLQLVATLYESDYLISPLLPRFSLALSQIFQT